VSTCIPSFDNESFDVESFDNESFAALGTIVSAGTASATTVLSAASPKLGKRRFGTPAMMKIMTKSSKNMSVFLLTAAKLQIICRISPAFHAFNVNYYEKSRLFEAFRPRKELLDAFTTEFLK
jgi:replicative DNA helicase